MQSALDEPGRAEERDGGEKVRANALTARASAQRERADGRGQNSRWPLQRACEQGRRWPPRIGGVISERVCWSRRILSDRQLVVTVFLTREKTVLRVKLFACLFGRKVVQRKLVTLNSRLTVTALRPALTAEYRTQE